MKAFAVISLLLTTTALPAQYRPGWKPVAAWTAYAMAGIMQGCREAYHADPAVFERKFGAAPLSWWGSEQWKRNYIGWNPDNAHKTEILGNVGRDMWHTFNAGRSTLAIGATFAIGAQKKPVKQRVIEVLIGAGLQVLAGNITYNILRQK